MLTLSLQPDLTIDKDVKDLLENTKVNDDVLNVLKPHETVLLVEADGGVVEREIAVSDALVKAKEAGKDLMLVEAKRKELKQGQKGPPIVCKLMDFEAWLEDKKTALAAKKSSMFTEVLKSKEMRFSVNISDHDAETKVVGLLFAIRFRRSSLFPSTSVAKLSNSWRVDTAFTWRCFLRRLCRMMERTEKKFSWRCWNASQTTLANVPTSSFAQSKGKSLWSCRQWTEPSRAAKSIARSTDPIKVAKCCFLFYFAGLATTCPDLVSSDLN